MTTSFLPEAPVDVKGRFHRSVQLTRDWQEGRDIEGYLLTPTVRDLTTRIVGELSQPRGTRAWSVTGPYGTGKSSFALFLAKLLAGQLEESYEFPPSVQGLERKPFLPVLLVGQRAPLKPALLAGLASSLASIDTKLANKFSAAARADVVEDDQVVVCL